MFFFFSSSGTRPGTCFAGWREGPLPNCLLSPLPSEVGDLLVRILTSGKRKSPQGPNLESRGAGGRTSVSLITGLSKFNNIKFIKNYYLWKNRCEDTQHKDYCQRSKDEFYNYIHHCVQHMPYYTDCKMGQSVCWERGFVQVGVWLEKKISVYLVRQSVILYRLLFVLLFIKKQNVHMHGFRHYCKVHWNKIFE